MSALQASARSAASSIKGTKSQRGNTAKTLAISNRNSPSDISYSSDKDDEYRKQQEMLKARQRNYAGAYAVPVTQPSRVAVIAQARPVPNVRGRSASPESRARGRSQSPTPVGRDRSPTRQERGQSPAARSRSPAPRNDAKPEPRVMFSNGNGRRGSGSFELPGRRPLGERTMQSGYSGDLDPLTVLELLQDRSQDVALVDIRGEKARLEEGLPELKGSARTRAGALPLISTKALIPDSIAKSNGGKELAASTAAAAIIRATFVKNDDTQVVILDSTGSDRARDIARAVRKQGLNKVCVVEGGFKAWERLNLPVARGKSEYDVEENGLAKVLIPLAGAALAAFLAAGQLKTALPTAKMEEEPVAAKISATTSAASTSSTIVTPSKPADTPSQASAVVAKPPAPAAPAAAPEAPKPPPPPVLNLDVAEQKAVVKAEVKEAAPERETQKAAKPAASNGNGNGKRVLIEAPEDDPVPAPPPPPAVEAPKKLSVAEVVKPQKAMGDPTVVAGKKVDLTGEGRQSPFSSMMSAFRSDEAEPAKSDTKKRVDLGLDAEEEKPSPVASLLNAFSGRKEEEAAEEEAPAVVAEKASDAVVEKAVPAAKGMRVDINGDAVPAPKAPVAKRVDLGVEDQRPTGMGSFMSSFMGTKKVDLSGESDAAVEKAVPSASSAVATKPEPPPAPPKPSQQEIANKILQRLEAQGRNPSIIDIVALRQACEEGDVTVRPRSNLSRDYIYEAAVSAAIKAAADPEQTAVDLKDDDPGHFVGCVAKDLGIPKSYAESKMAQAASKAIRARFDETLAPLKANASQPISEDGLLSLLAVGSLLESFPAVQSGGKEAQVLASQMQASAPFEARKQVFYILAQMAPEQRNLSAELLGFDPAVVVPQLERDLQEFAKFASN